MLRTIALVMFVISIFVIGIAQPSNGNNPKNSTVKIDMQEALERKTRSEVILKSQDVPINDWLPVIETEVLERSEKEIAYRCLALLVVAVKGESGASGDLLSDEIIDGIIDSYKLKSHFTPQELTFLNDKSPSHQDYVNFTWRYESAWVLLWALGYVDELQTPDINGIVDAATAVGLMHSRTTKSFIQEAELRPLSEILDQTDLMYRYHWATVDARINGKPAVGNLDSSIIYERHYALNWLIGYMNQAWDDISTDT